MVAVMLAQEPLLSYQYQLSVALPGPSYHCNTGDFLSKLKVGSCEHLEQIPAVRVTFVHATFVKGRFLGTS